MQNQPPPSIIFITCDELRQDSLGCYGNDIIATPNLDKLASKSIQCHNAYTPSPWCLPARSAILTGLYPHKSGAYSNFRKGVISPEMPNLFNLFQNNGYRTAMFGKCHFAPLPDDKISEGRTAEHDVEQYYQSLGIDDLYLQDGKSASVWFYDTYSRWLEECGYLDRYRKKFWALEENGSVFDFPAEAKYHPDMWVGKTTIDYIDSYESPDSLFAWMSFSGPHYPFDTPKEYLKRVDTSKIKPRKQKEGEFDDKSRIHHISYHGMDGKPGGIDASWRAPGGACKNFTEEYWDDLRLRYYANIAMIDDAIGEILDAVEKKFGDNTLIIFTADHGELLGDHGLWGKNNCAYEQVWKLPMLVKYPNASVSPTETYAKVSSLDILPTCLNVAGIPAVKCDGRDLLEGIADGGYSYVFAEGEGFVAVTDGIYKYVHVSQNGREHRELLDIATDPDEYENFIGSKAHTEKLNELCEQVIVHFMQTVLP